MNLKPTRVVMMTTIIEVAVTTTDLKVLQHGHHGTREETRLMTTGQTEVTNTIDKQERHKEMTVM